MELIPTLSLTEAVKVTVWLCEDVLRSTVVSSALKLLIDGLWSSLFVIVIVTDCVEILLAVSLTDNVRLSVFDP